MIHLKFQNISIPALGFGTWQLRGPECQKAVESALGHGYRHIDTAQIYENETEVGAALAGSKIPRGDIFLTTKVWMDRVAPGALEKSVEESLKKLKTAHVDLLLLHWPVAEVPLKDQIKALTAVHKAGLTRLIGVSNYTVAMLKEVKETLGAPVVNNQVEYHPFLSQKPLLDYTRAHGMFLTAYSPVARGKVTGHPLIKAIAGKYGKNEGQVALRWLLQQGNVAAIPKAASEKNIRSNIDIFNFALDDSEMKALHGLAQPDGRLVKPAWSPVWDQAA